MFYFRFARAHSHSHAPALDVRWMLMRKTNLFIWLTSEFIGSNMLTRWTDGGRVIISEHTYIGDFVMSHCFLMRLECSSVFEWQFGRRKRTVIRMACISFANSMVRVTKNTQLDASEERMWRRRDRHAFRWIFVGSGPSEMEFWTRNCIHATAQPQQAILRGNSAESNRYLNVGNHMFSRSTRPAIFDITIGCNAFGRVFFFVYLWMSLERKYVLLWA